MRMLVNYLLLLVGIIINVSFIPDSVENQKAQSFKKADVVFLGEIVKSEESTESQFKFNVYEVFKGEYDHATLTVSVSGDSTLNPIDDGLWIVFARSFSDSTFYIPKNSVSRSNLNPDLRWWYRKNIPPPPLVDSSSIGILNSRILELEVKNEATVDWYNDLEKLREIKKLTKPTPLKIAPLVMYTIMALNILVIILYLTGYGRRK